MPLSCETFARSFICWLLMLSASIAECSNFALRASSETPDSDPGVVVDARKIGVDCSGSSDSSPALNALSEARKLDGIKLVFPALGKGAPCLVRLASTWRIYDATSFTIDGGARCGLPGNCTRFKWTGSKGGTVIDMEQVFGFEIKNLTIDGNGTASIGVVVDQNVQGGIATYDGIFEGVLFNANSASGAPQDDWVGLSVSPTSTANVADIRVVDSAFECGSTGSGKGTIGYGLGLLSGSRNALLEVIRHNYFEHCGYGIYQRNGGAIIEENTFGGDAQTIDDIFLTGTSSHERITANWSESQYGSTNQFCKAAFSDVTGPGIEISGNQIPINNVCALDLGGNTISSNQPNVWYRGQKYGKDGTKACATTNGYAFTWSGPSGLTWPSDVTESLAAGIFFPGSLKNGPGSGMIANSGAALERGVPVKWKSATVVATTPEDKGAGVGIGVTANSPGMASRPTYIMTSGYAIMRVDGSCSRGQWLVVSSKISGHAECTSAFSSGKVIGTAMEIKNDGTVDVQVGLR